jgi:hypothetical protein
MSAIEKIFSNKDYCLSELREARKIFTSKELFNHRSKTALDKSLGLMYLYCDESIRDFVLSHIHEMELRFAYMEEIEKCLDKNEKV